MIQVETELEPYPPITRVPFCFPLSGTASAPPNLTLLIYTHLRPDNRLALTLLFAIVIASDFVGV